MRTFQNIKTFFLNYKILWKEFSIRLNGLTNERLIKEVINDNLQALKNQYIISKKADEKLLKQYIEKCERLSTSNKATNCN